MRSAASPVRAPPAAPSPPFRSGACSGPLGTQSRWDAASASPTSWAGRRRPRRKDRDSGNGTGAGSLARHEGRGGPRGPGVDGASHRRPRPPPRRRGRLHGPRVHRHNADLRPPGRDLEAGRRGYLPSRSAHNGAGNGPRPPTGGIEGRGRRRFTRLRRRGGQSRRCREVAERNVHGDMAVTPPNLNGRPFGHEVNGGFLRLAQDDPVRLQSVTL